MTVAEHSPSLADGDFVELSYTARLADNGRVIDTTDPAVAKDADIADVTATGPCVVVLGEGHLFDVVEEAIKGTDVGDAGRVFVDSGDAFGEVDPTAGATIDIEHIPVEQRTPGVQVWYKGRSGFVESTDEESARVNFNHPLAGSAIEYEFTVHRQVTSLDEQINGLLSLYGLTETIDARLETEGTNRVLVLDVTDPTEAVDSWETRKQQVLTDFRADLPLDGVRITERYPFP